MISKYAVRLAAIVSAGAMLAACGTSGSSSDTKKSATGKSKGDLTIASFDFAESQILANIYGELLSKAGYTVTLKSLTKREIIEPALEKGDLDVIPEYLASYAEYLNGKKNGTTATPIASGDAQKTLTAVRAIAEPLGVKVLEPTDASDQNAFAVKKDFASANNLTKLSDLASYKGKLVLGGPPECPKRPYCQPGLKNTYALKFTGFKALDTGGPLTKAAITKGQVQIGLVFSSDPSVQSGGLMILEDDKHLQNADVVTPVVNAKVDSADLATALAKLKGVLTTEELLKLNAAKGDPAAVAKAWVTSKSLV